MNREMGVTATLLAVLAVSALAGAYALWYDDLSMNIAVDTGEVDWEFVDNSWGSKDPCYLPDDGDPEGTAPLSGDDYNLYPQGTPPFSSPYNWSGQSPVRVTKDVGCDEVIPRDTDGDGDWDTLEFNIYNAYPFYYTQLTFDVRNNGTVPIKIAQVLIDENCDSTIDHDPINEINKNDVEVQGVYLFGGEVLLWWGDNFGVQLHHNDDAAMGMDIVVVQEAEENQSYNFCIKLQAVQWNEYDMVVSED
ncbi:esterase/lipase [Aeropyrum pernix]|uniref:Esterase/lipase n=1 Tax=Aeropyrum pernix TaxID=56636 RepID=A0A401HAG8_AERPX|nr:hypothetical protein [Aeropyrum pernix]GBF09370.1 esterase/lipase [Aeropyrum pernix]